MSPPEQQAREKIDAQLSAAGWTVQSISDLNLSAYCGFAVREMQSQLYFEQMKGRGTRTIDPDALASVTPDAGGKTRFVLVDADGVTESDKTDSRPMESKPSVAFDRLLKNVAA